MRSSVRTRWILVVICSMGLNVMENTASNTGLEDAILNRGKRANLYGRTIGRGGAAVKQLIEGALRLPNSEKGFKQFMKKGDFEKAVRDFHSVRPSYVKRYTGPDGDYGLIGKAGDRKITLNNGGNTGRPTIEIRRLKNLKKHKGIITDKITYDPFLD